MTEPIKVAAIVLAAGGASRFGSIKQLATLGGQPLVRQVANVCLECSFSDVFVAVGNQKERVVSALPGGATPVPVSNWQLGMGHSLACTVKQLPARVTHTLVVLADQVALTKADLAGLLSAAQCQPQQIIAASYSNTQGVPAVFPRRFFKALETLRGDRGARQILRENAGSVVIVDMPNAAIDIDCLDDLQRFCEGDKFSPHQPDH